MSKDLFIGTWRLLSWENRDENGKMNYPYGKDAKGYITYNEDGYMSVLLMKTGRANFAISDFMGGTDTEMVQAMGSFVSYCGKYSVHEKKVIHHLELCSFPNWCGTDQERFFVFQDGTLELSTAPFLVDGKEQSSRLLWKKVSD